MFENTESGLLTDDGVRAEDFNEKYENPPEEEQKSAESAESKWALRGRLRSKTMWAAAVGVIIVVFSSFNVWEKIGITVEGFKEIMTAVGALLAEFGVFNDPTNKEGF